jgi:hypothetical protein
MRIEEIWRELDAEAATGSATGWLTRLALPQPSQRLLVALETGSRRRSLLLPMPERMIPPPTTWPKCRGLELFSLALDGKPHFGVRLTDPASADVFAILAEDLAPRIASSNSPQASATALIGRLKRWQKFLTVSTSGLNGQQLRGLYGELFTLRETLLPRLGPLSSVTAWRAPTASHQDFQFSAGAIEVKTTAAMQPQSVGIASERQLDDTGVGALFLHVVVLDERVVEENSPSGPGETLPELIRGLRQLLNPFETAAEIFEDRLLDADYLDAHAHLYDSTRFALRYTETFGVKDSFPRIVERQLPPGIGEVSYALSLSACAPYSVATEKMLEAVNITHD